MAYILDMHTLSGHAIGYRQNGDKPKRLQPKRRHIQNGDTSKTATCTVLDKLDCRCLDVSDTSQHSVSDMLDCCCFGFVAILAWRRFGCVAILVVTVLNLSPF